MRIRSLKHKQLIALVLIALTPLFALTASMWMQAQNSKEQAVQTYQGYADTIAIALEKELDRQKERLEELKEKRAEEKKQEKKDVTVKWTTIQANSKEELLEKISELDWSKITEEKATQGMKFDITI